MSRISVIIHTWNEEKNLPRALASIRGLADEIVVVDMESQDKTREVARKFGARVFLYKFTGYVEPARNFGIGKATGDWVLILDADEELLAPLARQLKKIITQKDAVDFYRLPRKNIIFGKWVRYSRWWPDYQIRFFKKGQVTWSEIIHSVPETRGLGLDLPAKESLAIVHHNYASLFQYIERMNRYTDIQAKFLINDGYRFAWQDVLRKPVSEFVTRFFAGEGYKDGLHGLVLGLLQALSEVVLYAKIWEREKFRQIPLPRAQIENEITRAESELDHWLVQKRFRQSPKVLRALKKLLK